MTQAQLEYIANLLLAVVESIAPSEDPRARQQVADNLGNFGFWHRRHMTWQKYDMRRKRK